MLKYRQVEGKLSVWDLVFHIPDKFLAFSHKNHASHSLSRQLSFRNIRLAASVQTTFKFWPNVVRMFKSNQSKTEVADAKAFVP